MSDAILTDEQPPLALNFAERRSFSQTVTPVNTPPPSVIPVSLVYLVLLALALQDSLLRRRQRHESFLHFDKPNDVRTAAIAAHPPSSNPRPLSRRTTGKH